MADYSFLKQLAPRKDQTREFVFYSIVGCPTLLVAHAGETNKPFISAQLASARRLIARSNRALTPDDLSRSRDDDRKLYAKHVVKGWGSNPLKDATGSVPDFSPDVALDFLSALPNDMFDDLRVYCGSDRNFADAPEIDAESEGNA